MPCWLWEAVHHYGEVGAGGEFLGSMVHVWDSSGSAHVMLHIHILMKQSCSRLIVPLETMCHCCLLPIKAGIGRNVEYCSDDRGDDFGHDQLRSLASVVFASPTGYMLMTSLVLLYEIGVYSINSSKRIGNFHAVLNFNRLFLKLNRFVCN
jgi:hypothetical protein